MAQKHKTTPKTKTAARAEHSMLTNISIVAATMLVAVVTTFIMWRMLFNE